MHRALFACIGLTATAALACASPGNPNLERAETEYRAAAADPLVAGHAPDELREAESALERAQRAFRDEADDDAVDHLAYLATRRVEIARASALRNEAFARLDDPAPLRPSRRIEAARAAELAALLSELRTHETDRGLVVTVDDVLFDRDRAVLRSEALPDLARIADFLRLHPDLEVEVEGHADAAERDRGALDLSLARAEAVERYLVAQGVDPERILTRGFGASDPHSRGATAYGRQQNRRVEIVVVDTYAP
jgi:outer membrane protein OmpA-like peptidoglycan-associated protein